jgi:hypothetical protein
VIADRSRRLNVLQTWWCEIAEFILVTEYRGGEQLLINTEDITTVTQSTSSEGVATTYLLRRQYALLRVRENIAQLMMLLQQPVGRSYPLSFGGGVIGGVYPAQFLAR